MHDQGGGSCHLGASGLGGRRRLPVCAGAAAVSTQRILTVPLRSPPIGSLPSSGRAMKSKCSVHGKRPVPAPADTNVQHTALPCSGDACTASADTAPPVSEGASPASNKSRRHDAGNTAPRPRNIRHVTQSYGDETNTAVADTAPPARKECVPASNKIQRRGVGSAALRLRAQRTTSAQPHGDEIFTVVARRNCFSLRSPVTTNQASCCSAARVAADADAAAAASSAAYSSSHSCSILAEGPAGSFMNASTAASCLAVMAASMASFASAFSALILGAKTKPGRATVRLTRRRTAATSSTAHLSSGESGVESGCECAAGLAAAAVGRRSPRSTALTPR